MCNEIKQKIYSENILRCYLQVLHKKSINMYRIYFIFRNINAKYIMILSHVVAVTGYRLMTMVIYLLIYANKSIKCIH